MLPWGVSEMPGGDALKHSGTSSLLTSETQPAWARGEGGAPRAGREPRK